MLANTMNHRPGTLRDEVTVCVPGALLAAAPSAEAPPVFVDDSGTRRKLIRFTGLIVMLVLVGFLGMVGVALAVPSVGATVGLGDVTPFLVPGAAAKPPPPAPVAVVKKRVQTIAPVRHPVAKPKITVAPEPEPEKETPVVIAPPTTAPPVVDPPKSEAPVVDPPKSEAPVVDPPKSEEPPVVDPPKPADPPVVVDPPVVDPPASKPPVVDPPKQVDPAPAAPVLTAPVAQNG